MAKRQTEIVDTFLCFDANLPKLEECKLGCGDGRSPLCVHRFEHKVKIEYCNSSKFHGWSDLRILLYFFGRVLESVAEGSVAPDSIFIILTKDRDFVNDVRKEWNKSRTNCFLDLEFLGNSIVCNQLIVIVQQVDCPNYGHGRKDDLRCIFSKINSFISEEPGA